MKVIGIITTKNRIRFLEKAVQSAVNQSRRLDELIVVSDSVNENYRIELDICQKYDATLLTNEFTSNYAGSLNTALNYVIEKEKKKKLDIDDLYIALLDDDDSWDEHYIKECEKVCKNDTEFVVTGINYINKDGIKQLSIPTKLTINDFLKGNPHIQGSNTFIKITTLLKAGTFDENMSSTTDRDIFIRIMMLSPKYEVVDRHLVYVDAFDNRERITNKVQQKIEGLAKFYYKYQGLMNQEIKDAFFTRTLNYFSVDKQSITSYHSSLGGKTLVPNWHNERYTGGLVVGFIVTEYELGLRLLKQLIALSRPNSKIIILKNFINSIDGYLDVLAESKYDYEIITNEMITERIQNNHYDQWIQENYNGEKIITNIAISRSILQTHLYELSTDKDVIWILDDDMELKELVLLNGEIRERPVDIDMIIPSFKTQYDAVIGNYALDAPLPILSTLRTSLLDYVYQAYANKNNNVDETIRLQKDYYYDLTDHQNKHLETPIPIDKECSLAQVFSGKAVSRKLFIISDEVKNVSFRGGNTLIFNRELLLIPNISIKIGNNIGRRSDYFWTLLAKESGYKCIEAPFALVHNRSERVAFNYEKEIHKLLIDFLGSSFTKAIESVGTDGKRNDFYDIYKQIANRRLVKFIFSYYRIIGLLEILSTKQDVLNYQKKFSLGNLRYFINKFDVLLDQASIESAYDKINSDILISHNLTFKSKAKRSIMNHYNLTSLRLLGVGGEAIVFTDEKLVYKWFVKKLDNIGFLKEKNNYFDYSSSLYSLDFDIINGHDVLCYTYENSEPYTSGYTSQFAELINFAKEHGFSYTNFKKENFIVVNGTIKLIDYGFSIIPHNEEVYHRSIERVYQMLRYPFLGNEDFRQLVSLSYQGRANELNAGSYNFNHIVKGRYKEIIHDDKIIDLINYYHPTKILDYGAGKCKIANRLSEQYDISVFDIDIDTLRKRADKRVMIHESIDQIENNTYDLINTNLVLCSINNDTVHLIMRNITRLLKTDGHVLISTCNPLFNSVNHTELRTQGLQSDYHTASMFSKHIKTRSHTRNEYHRPLDYYIHLLQSYGLKINQVIEGEGVEYDTVLPISEHLIFDCSLKIKPVLLNNVSLLIKTNPMEHASIYDNVRHIVMQLEKGVQFVKKVIIVDDTLSTNRVRRYNVDNLEKLKYELNRLITNGLIDDIIYPPKDLSSIETTYEKYFGLKNVDPHCINGQAVYATLFGFDSIKTKYVFQTDSDIIYRNEDSNLLLNIINEMEEKDILTSTISIFHHDQLEPVYGCRTEVRTCLMNLHNFRKILPLKNKILQNQLALPWQRSLDERVLGTKQSARFGNNNLSFIHPSNNMKKQINLIGTVYDAVESSFQFIGQYEEVELLGKRSDWIKKAISDIVLYIRGYNTSAAKLKRLFDSLERQTYKEFKIVYVDDASTNESDDYARLKLNFDLFFKARSIGIFNRENVGTLENLVFVMTEVITNPNTIIINVDNDDFLVNDKAIEIIINEFSNGADLTVGNCIRYDKPLKHYKVLSFEKVWKRNGDNIWLHPKCFRKSLFDQIDINTLKIDEQYVNVNTDFSFIIPMIQIANKCVFIDEILYYFEPSIDNMNKRNKYNEENSQIIKQQLLERARDNYEKNNSGYRGQLY